MCLVGMWGEAVFFSDFLFFGSFGPIITELGCNVVLALSKIEWVFGFMLLCFVWFFSCL